MSCETDSVSLLGTACCGVKRIGKQQRNRHLPHAAGDRSKIPRNLLDIRADIANNLPVDTVDTHINHNSTHDDNVDGVEKLGFPIPTVVAYDGLKIL